MSYEKHPFSSEAEKNKKIEEIPECKENNAQATNKHPKHILFFKLGPVAQRQT